VYRKVSDSKDVVQVVLLDGNSFSVWGKPGTLYKELSDRINKEYIGWNGSDAFEREFSGNTFSKFSSEMKELTPRERKKFSKLLKSWGIKF